ncbi:MAG: glycosyltransferase family 2 protein [Chitinophagales bacterium]
MHKLTAIIPVKNEVHNIEAVLESVKWCDEILVVDSYSTDATVELAKKYTDRIIQSEYVNSASQKNRAIPLAKYEWILLVDADERVTPELKNEIEQILSSDKIEYDAFWIYRKNYFMGVEIRYSGWQNDKVIRLFKRDTSRYEEKHVHAEVKTSGKTGKLKNKLVHYTFKDILHYLEKLDRYSTWSAEDAAKKNVHPNLFHFVIKPRFRFFKHYFLKLGILDGYPGFIISALSAQSVLMRYIKLYDMQHDGNNKPRQ